MTLPKEVPCRVDFAGGWLDVPAFAKEGAYIVNCAISPLASLDNWPYQNNSGVGDRAAWAMLNGGQVIDVGFKFNGWQDAAVIQETGLCVWRSGPKPVLEVKVNPDFLNGLLALWYSGKTPHTINLVNLPRNYPLIARAGVLAAEAVKESNLSTLAEAVNLAHNAQLEEGMVEVPSALRSLAYKYVGSGHGGYVLYLFHSSADRDLFCLRPDTMAIEPYLSGSRGAGQVAAGG